MARVFIFTKQVQDIIKAGKREIDIPEGASISSAAADLIRENQIQVKSVARSKKNHPDVSGSSGQMMDEEKGGRRTHEISISETANAAAQPPEAGDFTEADVEEIVNRVISRIQHLKGVRPGGSRKKDGVPPPQKRAGADDDDLVICRCEEITKGEIKDCIRNGMQTLNGIKRVTRAGMGLCQGQTCQRLVSQILIQEMGLKPAEIDPTTARGPVRPLRLEVLANS